MWKPSLYRGPKVQILKRLFIDFTYLVQVEREGQHDLPLQSE